MLQDINLDFKLENLEIYLARNQNFFWMEIMFDIGETNDGE